MPDYHVGIYPRRDLPASLPSMQCDNGIVPYYVPEGRKVEAMAANVGAGIIAITE